MMEPRFKQGIADIDLDHGMFVGGTNDFDIYVIMSGSMAQAVVLVRGNTWRDWDTLHLPVRSPREEPERATVHMDIRLTMEQLEEILTYLRLFVPDVAHLAYAEDLAGNRIF